MDPAKIKEMINDSAKLEALIKDGFGKMDKGNKGYITYEELQEGFMKQMKYLGQEPSKDPAVMEKAKKIADPDNSGKVTFENFSKLVKAGIEKQKKEGKL